MNTLLRAAFAAALMLGSNAAMAQFYVGGGAGQSSIELNCTGTTSCDKKDTGYKGYVGYLSTSIWGVEASYTDFGKARAGVSFLGTPVEVGFQPRAYALFGLASATFANRVSAFGKVGVAYVDSRATATVGNASAGDTDWTATPAYGLGLGVRLVDGLEVRAEWERFRAEFGNEKGDVDFVSLSLRFWLPK